MSRDYTIGMPVTVTVHEDGSVSYEVDTTEASLAILDLWYEDVDTHEKYYIDEVKADQAALVRACERQPYVSTKV